MTDFRTVTPDFAVAQQISAEDIAKAKAAGFRAIINNRPDSEAPDLPSAESRALAEAAGLAYREIPFAGPPNAAVLAQTAAALADLPAPVLAYCRSGTRSITAWAMAQVASGAKTPDEVIALAGGAGYDLSGARGALLGLAPG